MVLFISVAKQKKKLVGNQTFVSYTRPLLFEVDKRSIIGNTFMIAGHQILLLDVLLIIS